ncbi:MAG TPA: hypothetical protein PKM21_15870 [Anaerolineales bacterium]|nr:hypothetical protein [Anaerolineales bacterium]
MLPKSLARLLEKHPDKIETIENETDTGDGYWLYLRPGWCTDDLGSHIIHDDTAEKLVSLFRYVQPCACGQCRKRK